MSTNEFADRLRDMADELEQIKGESEPRSLGAEDFVATIDEVVDGNTVLFDRWVTQTQMDYIRKSGWYIESIESDDGSVKVRFRREGDNE